MFLENNLIYPGKREALIFSSISLDTVVGGLKVIEVPTLYQIANGVINGASYTFSNVSVDLLEASDGQPIGVVTPVDNTMVDKTYINADAFTSISRQIAALEDKLDAHATSTKHTHGSGQYDIINSGSEIDGGVW